MAMMRLDPKKMPLNEQMLRTYQNLRFGLFFLGSSIPIIVVLSDYFELGGAWTRDSISAYYHSSHTLSRDLFVGSLCVVGVFLILYRGYSFWANLLLNFAGVLLIGVALFPTSLASAAKAFGMMSSYQAVTHHPLKIPSVFADDTFIERISYREWHFGNFTVTIHYFCAVVFFMLIGFITVFLSKESLKETMKAESDRKREFYEWAYNILGGLMIVMPVLVYIIVQLFLNKTTGIFWLEACGIWTFACYWLVKSIEFKGFVDTAGQTGETAA